MSLICCHFKLKAAFLLAALLPLLAAAGTSNELENDIFNFSYQLERWLDTSKRPCDDFYGYVCGRTQNATQQQLVERKQQQQAKFDKFMTMDEALDDQLMDSELKLKQFYVACKTTRTVEDLRSSHLYRMSSGWPAIDDSAAMLRKRRNATWLNVLGMFHDVGLEYFFRHRVEMKSNKRVVHLQPDENKRYTLRKFEQLATDVMQEYAVEEGRARLVALETLSFERSRREIVKTLVEDGDFEGTYADFKSRLFGNELAALDWDAYFKKLLGKSLKDSDMVVVLQLPKLKQLFELLEKTSITRLLNWLWIDYLMDKSSSECQSLAAAYFEPVYQHIVQRFALDKVEMAKFYASLGRSYDQLLPSTPWIDEMTQQNSKQFLGRIIHLTLNGDAKLDADYAALTITKRNFYRNLEKCQRFLTQRQTRSVPGKASSVRTSKAAAEFMKVFMNINALPREHNLTAPMSYMLVGEIFAEHMIAGGNTGSAPGAWRSMDSEREFDIFQQCIKQQQQTRGTTSSTLSYNINDLVLKMLAQSQTLHSFFEWQKQQDAATLLRVDSRLAGTRLQLSLRKLYFIGSVLTDCQRHVGNINQRDFVNTYLRNSPEFSRAFGCRSTEVLQARNVCKVL